jgi:hypothetical protein
MFHVEIYSEREQLLFCGQKSGEFCYVIKHIPGVASVTGGRVRSNRFYQAFLSVLSEP